MKRWQWVQRPQPSRFWSLASPLLALLLTVGLASLLFAALGKSPVQGLQVFFWEPIKNGYAWGELLLKATPLLLIGLGLSLCFRSNVWNIGAEGQFIMGAVTAGAVALTAGPDGSRWMVLPVLLAGMAGGMAWGAVVAWLRDRFHANEILVSLMLVYVAEQFLGYMVSGPLKDPDGYGFPLSKLFEAATAVPKLVAGSRVNIGLLLALLGAVLLWLYLFRTRGGFAQQVGGMAPAAARYAGFSSRRALWLAMLVSGGAAGLAGALEVAGPIGQLTLSLPAGYGFAAIIVAFVGRLHPVGVVFSSILMSMLYIGGELAQSRLGLPKSISLVFQGLLLFTLLACDTLIHSHWRRVGGCVPKGSEEGVGKEAGEEMLAPSPATAVALATEGVATGDTAVAAADASAPAPASAKGEAHHASHALAPGAASSAAAAVATTAPSTPNEQEDSP